jgi:predicted transcriptional regulator
VKIAIAMPDETYKEFKRLGRERSQSMAALMRDALHEYLERQKQDVDA